MDGRTYRYLADGEVPLYPFGYGLSYSKFEYSDLRLAEDRLTAGTDLHLHVTVNNLGPHDADEVST